MSWEKVYELWRHGSYYFPESLSEPLKAEPVFVKYAHSGRYIYGYDWLQKEIGEQRKIDCERPCAIFSFAIINE